MVNVENFATSYSPAIVNASTDNSLPIFYDTWMPLMAYVAALLRQFASSQYRRCPVKAGDPEMQYQQVWRNVIAAKTTRGS